MAMGISFLLALSRLMMGLTLLLRLFVYPLSAAYFIPHEFRP
jgi:hypothetical protein